MTNEEQKKEISIELETRIKKFGNNIRCPICNNSNFVITDGFIANINQDDLAGITLGGKTIPTVPVICTNCGFLAQFSAGVLGLLKGVKNENK